MRAYEDFVIAAVLPKSKRDKDGEEKLVSHLEYVMNKGVKGDYFHGPHRWLWRIAQEANLFQSKLDDVMVSSLLAQFEAPEEERQKALILFLDLSSEDVSFDKIKVVLPSFLEEVQAERLLIAMNDAGKALTEGLTVDRETIKGFKAAKAHLMQKVSELEGQNQGHGTSQEIRSAAADFLQEYSVSKTATEFGILTGFKEIDNLTRGIQKGEVWVMCAYTGEGKSQFMHNVGYNACTRQAKNIALISLEMPVAQVRRRTFVRHTCHNRFGLPGGLPYKRVKDGSLDVDQEKILMAAVNDFATNPDYGKFHVVQAGKSLTIPTLREYLMLLRARGTLDLVIVDYASLMTGVRKRNSRQEEIVEVIEGLKSLALTFNEGEGLAMLTANQISRGAKEEADKIGRYGINFAAETSAIEKNADGLLWLLRNDEMKANHEAKIGMPKYRDGSTISEFTVMEHYESGLLADLDDDDAQIQF